MMENRQSLKIGKCLPNVNSNKGENMQIGGFQKTSLIDYPEKVASVVWTIDCNFKCPFCYNVDLVLGTASKLDTNQIIKHLEESQGFIEGVVITGGEPLLQNGLKPFIKKVKYMGYLVKLDTNGFKPAILRGLIEDDLLDYVAMDVKAAPDRYENVTGAKVDVNNIINSINIIKNSKIDHEFRTTVVPGLVDKDDIKSIAKLITGAKVYYIQQNMKSPAISAEYSNVKPHSVEEVKEMQKVASRHVQCKIRLSGHSTKDL